MAQACEIPKCPRTVAALCMCCQRKICYQHITEHQEAIKERLNSLTDQFNNVNNRIVDLNTNDITKDARKQLEQWRDDYRRTIDEVFDRKSQELQRRAEEKMNNFKMTTKEVHTALRPIMENHDADQQTMNMASSKIQLLEQVLDNMNQRVFTITTQPVMIDPDCIKIEEFTEHSLIMLTFESTTSKKSRPGGSHAPITSNDRYLLYHHNPDLCLLNTQLQEIKKTRWKYEKIHGMCWCSSSQQFLITTEKKIFTVDENLNSIKQIQVVDNRTLYSCTCSGQSLFVLEYGYSSPILKYNMSPSIQFIREWIPPQTCQQGEWINDISCQGTSLALMIKNMTEKSCRIELKNSETFSCVWQCRLDIQTLGKAAFACCSTLKNGWFIFDTDNNQVLYIKEDGSMGARQSYNETFWCATMFGKNRIAITTRDSINFHNFETSRDERI